jgi:hypothetical protein
MWQHRRSLTRMVSDECAEIAVATVDRRVGTRFRRQILLAATASALAASTFLLLDLAGRTA